MLSGRVRESRTIPYLFVCGPTGTGKNRVGDWLVSLCQRGFMVGAISESYLFRLVDRHKPTLVINEAEKLNPYRKVQSPTAEALREILNMGYEQGQYVGRVDKETGGLYHFDPYGFKVLLSTEDLPETTKARCIEINTEENVRQDIPVEGPRRDHELIAPLKQNLEWYWGQFEPGSLWAKTDPDARISLDELKNEIGNYRTTQIFGPLLQMIPDRTAYREILDLAVESAQARKDERGVGRDAEILQALAQAREADPTSDRYGTADIAKRYNDGREKWEHLSSDQVGGKLRKFGLRSCKLNRSRARGVLWDEAKLARRFNRYAIVCNVKVLPIQSQDTSRHEGPENGFSKVTPKLETDTRDTLDTSVRQRQRGIDPGDPSATGRDEEVVFCKPCGQNMPRRDYRAHECPGVIDNLAEYS